MFSTNKNQSLMDKWRWPFLYSCVNAIERVPNSDVFLALAFLATANAITVTLNETLKPEKSLNNASIEENEMADDGDDKKRSDTGTRSPRTVVAVDEHEEAVDKKTSAFSDYEALDARKKAEAAVDVRIAKTKEYLAEKAASELPFEEPRKRVAELGEEIRQRQEEMDKREREEIEKEFEGFKEQKTMTGESVSSVVPEQSEALSVTPRDNAPDKASPSRTSTKKLDPIFEAYETLEAKNNAKAALDARIAKGKEYLVEKAAEAAGLESIPAFKQYNEVREQLYAVLGDLVLPKMMEAHTSNTPGQLKLKFKDESVARAVVSVLTIEKAKPSKKTMEDGKSTPLIFNYKKLTEQDIEAVRTKLSAMKQEKYKAEIGSGRQDADNEHDLDKNLK